MDKGYEIFEHTSEVGFRSFGRTTEEAFENAGRAAFSIMVDIEKIKVERTVDFEVSSENLKALLYDFLDELIYIRDIEDMVFSSFDVHIEKEGDGFRLGCSAGGQEIGDMAGHDVKAVTYNQMEIKEEKEGFMVQVVLDV